MSAGQRWTRIIGMVLTGACCLGIGAAAIKIFLEAWAYYGKNAVLFRIGLTFAAIELAWCVVLAGCFWVFAVVLKAPADITPNEEA